MMDRIALVAGSFFGLTGVIMAALSAHLLPHHLSPVALGLVQTGVEMQMWHALALLACGVLLRLVPGPRWLLAWAAAAFILGILAFAGALYLLGIAALPVSGLAPLGGFSLMAGWILLGLWSVRARAGKRSDEGPRAS